MLFVVFVGFFAALSTILIGNIFKTNFFSESISQIDFNLLTDDLNNIDIFGQVLFNYYMSCFLLAGFILLIALVGSIVLTLRFNNTDEGQIVNKQLSRTDNFYLSLNKLMIFKKPKLVVKPEQILHFKEKFITRAENYKNSVFLNPQMAP